MNAWGILEESLKKGGGGDPNVGWINIEAATCFFFFFGASFSSSSSSPPSPYLSFALNGCVMYQTGALLIPYGCRWRRGRCRCCKNLGHLSLILKFRRFMLMALRCHLDITPTTTIIPFDALDDRCVWVWFSVHTHYICFYSFTVCAIAIH